MNQIELHNKIDKLITKDPLAIKPEEVRVLIPEENKDAWQYFFTQADEHWLSWLWDNGFLDVIKEKSDDPTRYGGRKFPELDYLLKVSAQVPEKVVKIMLEVKVSKDNFNPGVLDRFLWICGSHLRAEDLKLIIPKIEKDKWVQLMNKFNQWGFEYEKIFQTLQEAKDYNSIITLAKAVLSVRSKDMVKKDEHAGFLGENSFYFHDLSHTNVFKYLSEVDNEHAEQALALVVKIITEVIHLGEKSDPKEVFPIREPYHLFDVDFFSLELDEKKRLSHRDNIRNLASVIKELAKKTIGEYDTDQFKAKKLYDRYFNPLPDSHSMWRLKLYVMSLYPEYFKNELEESFFKLFEVMDAGKSYHDIISGAEYEKTLQKGFPILSDPKKREYVQKVIEYFKRKEKEGKNNRENWHLRNGADILSVIIKELTKPEIEKAKKAGFKLNPEHQPEPSIKMDGFAHTVVHQTPFTDEDFQKMSISEISDKLRGEWVPEVLFEKYKNKSVYHRPISAEGVGNSLEKDIKNRIQEYIDSADKFFERGKLDPHYTYSFFRGIQEAIKNNKELASNINWKNLIDLFLKIKDSGEKPFEDKKEERVKFDYWLVGWTAVHSSITDILHVLLDGKPTIKFSEYRNDLFVIIEYLLNYPNPTPENEKLKTASMTTSSTNEGGQVVSDPFTMAINTVRGRAFQAFLMFIYQDGKKLNKDVKKLYENVLEKENTRAIMFMFGYYLPPFYFRGKNWIKDKILPKVFPEDPSKNNLYTASWEGYLANNLYNEIFFEPEFQDLYKRGIVLTDTELLQQRRYKDPDEGLATHLALAFMHYKDFDFDHPLFIEFWEKNDPEQHAHFVSFLGRSFISGSNTSANELLEKGSEAKDSLKKMWDYLLDNCKDVKPFEEMGFWVSLEKNIFETKWLAEHTRKTLEKSKGILDWELGLMKTIEQLAKEAPEDTLEIVRLYLLEGGIRGENRRIPLHVDNEWHKAFEALYNNPDKKVKQGVSDLINELIKEGGSSFWGLKSVLETKEDEENK